ncbi:MAG TPA: hypothetical protein PKE47_13500, partial [Verrucomicrobiota bacterium]|nr:hypothetical protein [Verrucomicrobiota bacterium]
MVVDSCGCVVLLTRTAAPAPERPPGTCRMAHPRHARQNPASGASRIFAESYRSGRQPGLPLAKDHYPDNLLR